MTEKTVDKNWAFEHLKIFAHYLIIKCNEITLLGNTRYLLSTKHSTNNYVKMCSRVPACRLVCIPHFQFSGSCPVRRLANDTHPDMHEPCDARVNGHMASEKIRHLWQIGLTRFPDAWRMMRGMFSLPSQMWSTGISEFLLTELNRFRVFMIVLFNGIFAQASLVCSPF